MKAELTEVLRVSGLALATPVLTGLAGIGTVVALRAPRWMLWLAPAVGLFACGWLALVVAVAGLPPGPVVEAAVLILAAAGGWHVWRTRADGALTPLAIYFAFYGVVLVYQLTVPFPGMWLMGGDWWFHYSIAAPLSHGTLVESVLSRSPYFAGGASFLLWGRPDLAPYQCYATAASASALLALLTPLQDTDMKDRRRRAWLLLPFVASGFFLLVAQNLWPKHLAAALFTGACVASIRFSRGAEPQALWWALGLFFASVAIHESSLLLVALPLALGFGAHAVQALRRPKFWLVAGLMAVVSSGWWIAYTLAAYGLDARVAANPAVAWDQHWPWWQRFGANLLSGFACFLPWDLAERWGKVPVFDLKNVAAMSYYTAVGIVSAIAATTIGILLPYGIALKGKWREQWSRLPASPLARRFAVGATLGLIAFCFVHPSPPPRYGLMQTGLVQVAWVALFLASDAVAAWPDQVQARLARGAVAFGLLPVLAISLPISLLTKTSLAPGLRTSLVANDADFACIVHNHLLALSDVFFPLSLAVTAGLFLLALAFVLGRCDAFYLRQTAPAPSVPERATVPT